MAQTYMTIVKLLSENKNVVSEFEKAWQEVKNKAEIIGVKNLRAYGLLGCYYLTIIYEASNEQCAAKISLIFKSRGILHSETWNAIPVEEFINLINR